jgi:hypothetical protein
MAFVSDQPIDLKCPGCGHTFQKTLGWLEANHNCICPGCQGEIELKFPERGRIAKVDCALADFQRTIDDVNRRG